MSGSSPYELITAGSIPTDHPQQPPTRGHDTWTPVPPAPLTSAYASALGREPEFTNFAMTAWQSAGDPFVGTLDYIFLSAGWKTKEVSHPRVTRAASTCHALSHPRVTRCSIHVSRAVASHPRARACATGQAAAVAAAHAAIEVVPVRDRTVRPPSNLGGPRARLITRTTLRGARAAARRRVTVLCSAARAWPAGARDCRRRGTLSGTVLLSGVDPAALTADIQTRDTMRRPLL